MTKEEAKEYQRQYYQKKKSKWLVYKEKWIANNPETNRKSKEQWRERNRDKHNAYNKQWAKDNPGKVTAYSRAYQLLKVNRMPLWLSAKDREAIVEFYENRPAGFHVDHIVPLKGKIVSGLHVPWNLQYLPARENVKKSNKHK